METSLGEVYLAHLCSRPFVPELRCTLGRETAMQKFEWTADGWLRLCGGGNLAKADFVPSALPDVPVEEIPERDDLRALSWPNTGMRPAGHPSGLHRLLRGAASACGAGSPCALSMR